METTTADSVLARIAKAHYRAEPKDVKALAAVYAAGLGSAQSADGTYLRILVANVQGVLGKPARGRGANVRDTTAALSALAEVSDTLYPAVLEGVSAGLASDDLAERNRRATFARTAKSTLYVWIETGGDVRALSLDTVTKTSLRAEIRSRRGIEHPSLIERATQRIEREVTALEAEDPAAAMDALAQAIARLQTRLDAMADERPEKRGRVTLIGRKPVRSEVHVT